MEFKADLHCHSTCSDGTFSPKELLELAFSKNLQGISITDHDTIQAYTDALFDEAKKFGIRVLTGVEFSCQIQSHSVHILGYNFSLKNNSLLELCQQHMKRRLKRNEAIAHKLKKQGLEISLEKLKNSRESTVIGRPHIASLMVEKGYVQSIDEAFKKYIGEGRPCFDPGEEISVKETLDIIKQAGGKAFIAHPHLVPKKSIVYDLLKLPFDGIECYYGNFPLKKNLPWCDVARRYNLLKSGGSDFHGANKPNINLGASYTTLEDLEKIYR